VNDLGMNAARPELGAGMYTPVAPGERHPVYLLVRPGGDPAAFVPRLRAIASSVEPLLLVDDPAPLADVVSELLWEARLSSVVFALIAVIAILLSTAGLYALMSFTVSERTREIGIRIALGARRSSIARIVGARSALQLVLGVAGGVWLGVFVVGDMLNSSIRTQQWPLTLAAVAAIMGTAGLVACLVPTARAMRIPAVRALRANG
jgi:putative ABC transport system permease protein